MTPRRLPSSSRPLWKTLGALFTFGLLFGAGSTSRAQTTSFDRSFDVQLFQPAFGPKPFLTVDSAQIAAHGQFGLQLYTNYQNSPFSLYTVLGADRLEKTVEVVRDQVTSELAGYVGLYDRLQVGLAIPVHLYMKGDDINAMGMPTGTNLKGGGIGDLRLEAKIKGPAFGPHDEFLLSVAPGLTIPTGDDSKYQGDASVTGRLKGILEFQVDQFRTAALLGFQFRKPSESFAAKVGQQLLYGLAAEYKVHRDVGLLAELFGRSGLEDFGKRYVDANPLELDGAMRVSLPARLSVTAGAGVGLVKGIGSPRFRALLGLAWSPDFRDRDADGVPDVEDRCPDDPEDRDGYKDSDGCPETDNDGDGVLDAQDRCPNDPEDVDQFQDEDGCPEADNDADGIPDINDPCPNAAEDGRGKRPKDGCPSSSEDADGDGVPDAKDKCPDEPEDRDGFQDYDGCPDPDNDEDNIPDQFDTCPNEAEDADGFEDSDGCPDPDNDKDGVADKQDKCPLEAETLNGNKDDDGCPDPGAEIVHLVDDRIEVRERIGFSGGSKPMLTAGGQAVVNMVAMVLRGHREIDHLRIEVSGDKLSKDETQARADLLAAALNAKGVETARLKPIGMGAGGNKVDFIIESRAEPQKKAATPAKE